MTILLPPKTNSIEQVRYGCSIGATHTASAIPGVIPITHCGPGCADKQFLGLGMYHGWQGAGYGAGAVIPSTNLSEREVVFGGMDRLRQVIDGAFRVLNADLFVVLTGCVPDLVGDDVGSVVSEFQEDGRPVVFAETGGFRGTNFTGHEAVIRAIVDQYVGDDDGPKTPGLVNVWCLLPYHNPFWRGDLAELKRVLEGAGLSVNILFGHEAAGVSEWKSIPRAQFNLLLSPWLGLETVRHLEKKYNQPFLHLPHVPIGAPATGKMLRDVAAFADLPPGPVDAFIKSEERRYYKYLEDFTTFFSEYWWGVPSRFAVFADANTTLAITDFFTNQMGLTPTLQVITDAPPEQHRPALIEAFRGVAAEIPDHLYFEEDSHRIHALFRKTDFGQKPPIVFGSTWEHDVARETQAALVEVTFPASYEVVLNRTIVGYRGALSLLEKAYSTVISRSAG